MVLSQSFMSPRFAGGPRGPPIRMSSQVEAAFMNTSETHRIILTKNCSFNEPLCCFPVSHQGEVQVLIPCYPTWTRPDRKVRLVHSQLHRAGSLSAGPHVVLFFPHPGHPNLGPMQRMSGPRVLGPMGPGPQVDLSGFMAGRSRVIQN